MTPYGLHWDGPVAWLVQGRGGANFLGLKAPCPFRGAGSCNHLIPSAAPIPDQVHWEQWQTIFKDSLVQMLLPVPGQRIGFFSDPEQKLALYLLNLSRLSSPINSIVKPAWTLKVKDLERELSTSNIQPLVVVQATAKHQGLIDALGQMSLYAPRPVVIVGSPDVVVRPPIVRMETNIDSHPIETLITLPLESIGAAILRRAARRERLDAPMESREARRDRQIKERNE